MNREDIQKLLGGYATGTLTPDEQEALFAAALEDQELFDALGREQALRDLLRDPAAKAELLAALETPVRGGFWDWFHRPLAVGLATAGVAAIAVMVVWMGTRLKPPATAMMAQVTAPASKSPEMPAAKEVKATDSKTKAEPAPVGVRAKRRTTPQPSASPERQLDQAVAVSPEKLKKEMSAATPAVAPPPPPPPAPATAAAAGQSVAESVAVQADAAPVPQPRFQALNAPADKLTLDARALFYGNSFAPRKDAVVPGGVVGGAPPPSAPKFANARTVTATGKVAANIAAATSLGVRVSILRGTQEAAVTTVLDPGESVRLKLTPNQDGFLYVAAREGTGWKMVAGGPARRLVPFETPPLTFQGSGQKVVYVMLSRQPQALSPQSLAGLVRANLVEAAAEPDRATYVVASHETAPPVQVVQPITLMYR